MGRLYEMPRDARLHVLIVDDEDMSPVYSRRLAEDAGRAQLRPSFVR